VLGSVATLARLCEHGLMSAQTTGVIPTLTRGQRLTVAMEYADLKPETMALQMRCSATTIRNYLSERTRIDWAHLSMWAAVTGVDAHWLETGEAATGDGPGIGVTRRELASVAHISSAIRTNALRKAS
jgi:hypothetical protein